MPKGGLGKGLGALIPQMNEYDLGNTREVRLDDITPNPYQPRKEFNEEKLAELASSIREYGLLQPLVVKPVGDRFLLIAGERRWRASRMAGLTTVPVVVNDADDRSLMAIALVENLQREDLNPLEAALAYRRLIDEFQLTQEEVAARVGKSRPAVSNTLRLLTLPEAVQTAVASGDLSEGHARALLGLSNESDVLSLWEQIREQGLSVRATEQQVRRAVRGVSRETKKPASRVPSRKDADLVDVEDQLRTALGTQVRLKGDGSRGWIEIEYYGQEDLTRLLERILGVS